MSVITSLHTFFGPFITVESAEKLYLAAGFVFALWYIPQIIRLMRDTTGAAALSLNTLFFQMCLRVPGLLYSCLAEQNVVFYVILLDAVGRGIVLGIAATRRVHFHNRLGDKAHLFGALAAVDMDEQSMIANEKTKRHIQD